jgi:hypothetical protein
VGNGEWGMGTRRLLSNLHSLFPTPHSHLNYIAPGDTEEAERKILGKGFAKALKSMRPDYASAKTPAERPIAAQNFSRKTAGSLASENRRADRAQQFFEIP